MKADYLFLKCYRNSVFQHLKTLGKTWSEKRCHNSFEEAGPLHSLFVGKLKLILGSSTNMMCTTGFCNALLGSISICDACIIFRGNMSVGIINKAV